MAFELVVVSNTPMTPVHELDDVAIALLRNVGYFGRGGEDEANVRESVAYRMFRDCFLMRADKAWTAEELIATLETSRPTVYRHLNKLKSLDLLEESGTRDGPSEATGRKAYRIRYGNLAKAWNFVEANVKVAMENYRKTVDHLQALSERAAKEP